MPMGHHHNYRYRSTCCFLLNTKTFSEPNATTLSRFTLTLLISLGSLFHQSIEAIKSSPLKGALTGGAKDFSLFVLVLYALQRSVYGAYPEGHAIYTLLPHVILFNNYLLSKYRLIIINIYCYKINP